MALNANKVGNVKQESNFIIPKVEPGVYPARLVQVIDLGVQPQRPYKGTDKPPAQEIRLVYEMSDEFLIDKETEEVLEDKPLFQSETIPLRNLKADAATSTKRYYALDPDEKHGGDFAQLVSTPCDITLVVNEKNDRRYVNVAAVSPMRPRKAESLPELVNPALVFEMDNPDLDVFLSLPKWIQEKIQSALNFHSTKLSELLEGRKGDVPAEEAEGEHEEAGPDDGDAPW